MMDDEYTTGYVNGIDHGIKLRAENRIPVVICNRCGQSHDGEE